MGGSADLTPSNNTKAKDQIEVKPGQWLTALRPLRRAGAWDGGGDEWHRPAWRVDPLWRHIPVLRGLLPPRYLPRGDDGYSHHLRDESRFHRKGRGRTDASAGRTPVRSARHPFALSRCSGPATRWKPRNAGRSSSTTRAVPPCWPCRASPCRCAENPAWRTAQPAAPTC